MNIAFLTTLNPYDINNWSGTTYHLLQTLSRKHHVKVIGQNTLSQTAYYIKDNFSKKHLLDKYAPLFGELYAEQMSGSDLIFFGDLYLASFLEVNIPMVHLSDVTYHSFKDYSETKRSKEQIKRTEALEKKLLNKYTSIIYSSEWTKQNTIDYYDIEPNKIHVVEFGANIPAPSDYKISIQTDTCNLVFIGKNWKKKGGDKVFMAYRKLKSKGLQCTLTIIGSTPQEPYDEIKDVAVIPFLDKSKPEHLKKFCNILKEAHFLVLPTEFDAFGIVFCEASAYGVPSIAANVGGVSQPVKEGKNGFLLPPNATAEDYAEKIKSVFSDKDGYIKLRESSRREYETRLNWEVWGEKVNKILEETVVNYKKCDNKTICQCNNATTCNLLSDNNISIGRQSKEQPLIDKEEFYVPVYVINLKERIERRKHIEEQFHGKPEFELTWVEAVEHPIGAVGLWQSMVKAVQMAEDNEDDIMIICEDDHTFTSAYSKTYLWANMIQANEQGSELLSGGIGGFGAAVPVATNRYWVDWFWSTQFMVIFKPLFQKILDYDFKDTDTADGVLSILAKDKMVLYPFISIQKDFGYSDVTRSNNDVSGLVNHLFQQSDYRLRTIHHVAHKFRQEKNDK
nr:glycosyltransferase [Tannerella forsythia]